jgi:hypothetical protein
MDPASRRVLCSPRPWSSPGRGLRPPSRAASPRRPPAATGLAPAEGRSASSPLGSTTGFSRRTSATRPNTRSAGGPSSSACQTPTKNSSPPHLATQSPSRRLLPQQLGEVDQAGVPGAVAVLVVYGLEPVEVEQRQRERPLPALGPGDIFGEAPFGGPAVVGAREVVRGGQLPEGPHRRVQPLDGVLDVGHEPPRPGPCSPRATRGSRRCRGSGAGLRRPASPVRGARA